MTWSEQDKENIKKAIAQGVTTVSIQGRMVSYRSVDELIKILQLIENELSGEGSINVIDTEFRRKR